METRASIEARQSDRIEQAKEWNEPYFEAVERLGPGAKAYGCFYLSRAEDRRNPEREYVAVHWVAQWEGKSGWHPPKPPEFVELAQQRSKTRFWELKGKRFYAFEHSCGFQHYGEYKPQSADTVIKSTVTRQRNKLAEKQAKETQNMPLFDMENEHNDEVQKLTRDLIDAGLVDPIDENLDKG